MYPCLVHTLDILYVHKHTHTALPGLRRAARGFLSEQLSDDDEDDNLTLQHRQRRRSKACHRFTDVIPFYPPNGPWEADAPLSAFHQQKETRQREVP